MDIFDTELVEMADKNQRYEMEDVFIGSQYLSMEMVHPCFDDIDIENPEELPEDFVLEYFGFDEEDFEGITEHRIVLIDIIRCLLLSF